MAQQKQIRLEAMRLPVQSLAMLSELRSVADVARILCSWGCGVGSYSSDATPNLETSKCQGYGPKKTKKKKEKEKISVDPILFCQ